MLDLVKTIKLRANSLASDASMDLEAYAAIFPQLLWVVRDLSLSTEAGSAKNYMETALEEKNGISDTIEKINRTRRLIKTLF